MNSIQAVQRDETVLGTRPIALTEPLRLTWAGIRATTFKATPRRIFNRIAMSLPRSDE